MFVKTAINNLLGTFLEIISEVFASEGWVRKFVGSVNMLLVEVLQRGGWEEVIKKMGSVVVLEFLIVDHHLQAIRINN